MGYAVTLQYEPWLQQFPEFQTTVSQFQWNLWLNVATTLHRNDGGGPVSNAQSQTNLLSLALAHLLFLYCGTATQPKAQVVGRITNATEGSVSVATDYGSNVSQQMAFWIQSEYGATYWALSAVYRTARYLPGAPSFSGGFYSRIWPVV